MLKYVSKSPHRNLLEEKLRILSPQLKGTILDVGSKNRPYDHLLEGKVIAIDLKPEGKGVEKGDIANLDFPQDYFDGVLSTEVLEYIKEPQKAVSEVHRVLKKDSVALISTPFMYKFHHDFLRFTKDYLNDLFSKFTLVEIYPIGNFYTIILDILRDKIIHLRPAVLRYILYLPYFFLVLFIKPSQILIKDQNFVSGYLVCARK